VANLVSQIEDILAKTVGKITDYERQLKNPKQLKKGLSAADKENLAKLQQQQVAASREMTTSYNAMSSLKQDIYKLEQLHAN
jgi:hypothetical protein